ncbi:MAG: chemotaxis protein CheW [Candidatus Nitrospinota bacterium M3_3B_026]
MTFDDFDEEEELEDQDESQWVLFELAGRWFAVSIDNIRELVITPKMTELPDSPPHVLGLINLRELTIPVIDLRVRLGMKSAREERAELAEMLKARKRDHVDWLDELKASVNESREFRKQMDPEKCEFGIWYGQFRTDDLVLSGLLKKFDAPHRAIHGVAAEVKGLEKQGRIDEAHRIITRAENRELKRMIELFDSVVSEIGRAFRDVVLIVDIENISVGLLVDRVESVITLRPEEIGPPPMVSSAEKSEKVLGVARPKGQDKTILLLDPAGLVEPEKMETLIVE